MMALGANTLRAQLLLVWVTLLLLACILVLQAL